jgi:hypothetical protein
MRAYQIYLAFSAQFYRSLPQQWMYAITNTTLHDYPKLLKDVCGVELSPL